MEEVCRKEARVVRESGESLLTEVRGGMCRWKEEFEEQMSEETVNEDQKR